MQKGKKKKKLTTTMDEIRLWKKERQQINSQTEGTQRLLSQPGSHTMSCCCLLKLEPLLPQRAWLESPEGCIHESG